MPQSGGSSTTLHRWHRMVRQVLHEHETALSAASPANRSRGLIKCAKESARYRRICHHSGRRSRSARRRLRARRPQHRGVRPALRDRGRRHRHRNQHRHSAGARTRHWCRQSIEDGRPCALSGEIRRPQRLSLLRSRNERGRKRAARDRNGLAPGHCPRRVRTSLPADHRHENAQDLRCRSAGALAPSDQGPDLPRQVHPARRRDRFDHANRRMGAAGRLYRGRDMAADIKVAVNLSLVQFRKADLAKTVMRCLSASGLPPERLELEITETALIESAAECLPALRHFKTIGITIVLDDFGTGYSSLSQLAMFPFDKIKIDKSFTQNLTKRSECAAIISATLTLAQNLNIATTAEGVETVDQYRILRLAGVTSLQGYLFKRPGPASEIDFDQVYDGGGKIEVAA